MPFEACSLQAAKNNNKPCLTCWSAGCLLRTRVGRGRRGAAAPAAPDGATNWSSAIAFPFGSGGGGGDD